LARYQRLNEAQIADLFDPRTEQRELVRHYALSGTDLTAIKGCRGDHNCLGDALMMVPWPPSLLAVMPLHGGHTCPVHAKHPFNVRAETVAESEPEPGQAVSVTPTGRIARWFRPEFVSGALCHRPPRPKPHRGGSDHNVMCSAILVVP